jgi:hypothetical protein
LELAFDESAREQYTASFDEYAEHLERVALRNSGRYVGLSSAVPVDQAIFGSMVKAGALE